MLVSRKRTAAWVWLSLLPAVLAGCAPSSGGGGNPDSNDNTTQQDNTKDNTPDPCAAPPPDAFGGNRLPRYELLPVTPVPRRVREAERLAQVDLSESVPTPCNQGALNSCAAWAGGFGLMTYLAAANIDGWVDLDRTDRNFSPTFVFNQANAYRMGHSKQDSCLRAGTYLVDMFGLLRDTGCATWGDMPYQVDDCKTLPAAEVLNRAADFKIQYHKNVPRGDVVTVQSYLGQGIPLVVNLTVGDVFAHLSSGETLDEVDEDGFCHAVLVVGYDNDLAAVKIMNSWGTQWGDGGFGFISYDIWPEMNTEAYVVGNKLDTLLKSVDDASGGKWTPGAQAAEDLGGCRFNPQFDTDGDGYPDSLELEFASFGFDPNVPDENPDFVELDDTDADGWPDVTEVGFETDPRDAEDYPFRCAYELPAVIFDEPDAVACTDYFLFELLRFASGGTGPRGVAVADLNQDGMTDVVLANADFDDTGSGANVTVLLGNGDGTLDAPAVVATGQAPRYLATSLLNGDAFVDLAFTDDDQETVSVLPGNGDGTFAAGEVLAIAGGSGPIALADLDADGANDLVVPGMDNTTLFFGVGDGTFPTQQTADVGLSRTPVVPADLNNDGVVDLAGYTVVDGNFGVAVLLGAGDGTFAQAEYIDFGPLQIAIPVPNALAPGDFDGDGNTDLAVALVADSRVSILFGAGDGTLPGRQDVSTTALVVQPDGLAVIDLDGDGPDDLALGSQTGDVAVLRRNDDGSFTESIQSVADGEVATIVSLAVNDLDGDGDADLVVPAGVPAQVIVLRSVCGPAGGS
jgi:hypothetical protein